MPNPYDILLVEDSATDAELTMRALRKRNLADKVHWVKNGQESLDFIFGACAGKQDPFFPVKLIFMDVKMPKMGGLEALRQLKANPQTRLIPIVMLTSSQEPNDLWESYKLGANSYIVKPMAFQEFAELIGSAAEYWVHSNSLPPGGELGDG